MRTDRCPPPPRRASFQPTPHSPAISIMAPSSIVASAYSSCSWPPNAAAAAGASNAVATCGARHSCRTTRSARSPATKPAHSSPTASAPRSGLPTLGAVAIKNSVYALPFSAQASEDFQWLRKEITAGGGEASVCRATFVDGLSDGQIEDLFRTARDVEYTQLTGAAEKADSVAEV